MKFNIASELNYQVTGASTLLLNIHALRTPAQAVLEETLTIDPYLKAEELNSTHGENRFVRIEVPEAAEVKISYKATVDNSFTLANHSREKVVPISAMDPSIFPYLFPSRYCQSDKLFRFANSKFGKIKHSFDKVAAITDWIHTNVEYLSGASNSSTSAFDTVTGQAGVCRDFAHLGIALCRTLSIPARYFTGYAYRLVPQDFHACFEAYLGGDWVIFDATKLAPLNGMVKIATGRDAADTAIANLYGDIFCNSIAVSCELAGKRFKPLFYEPKDHTGITYR